MMQQILLHCESIMTSRATKITQKKLQLKKKGKKKKIRYLVKVTFPFYEV